MSAHFTQIDAVDAYYNPQEQADAIGFLDEHAEALRGGNFEIMVSQSGSRRIWARLRIGRTTECHVVCPLAYIEWATTERRLPRAAYAVAGAITALGGHDYLYAVARAADGLTGPVRDHLMKVTGVAHG